MTTYSTYIVNLKSSDAYVYKEITNANNNKQLVFCGALIFVISLLLFTISISSLDIYISKGITLETNICSFDKVYYFLFLSSVGKISWFLLV